MKISNRLKNSFEDVLAKHFTKREIERFFENNDIENKINGELPSAGIRRALTRQFYDSVNWDNNADVKNILYAFSDIFSALDKKNSEYGIGYFGNPFTEELELLRKNITKDGLSFDGNKIIEGTIQKTNQHFDSQLETAKNNIEQEDTIKNQQELANTLAINPITNVSVFISYSWDDEPHKEWVLKLANDLIHNGVNVLLDRYELKAGKNMAHFMERAVGQADFVLCILTPNYKTKANNRTSGVGFEYSMISQSLFLNQSSDKFIPILRSGNQATSSPSYLGALLYHDMVDDSEYKVSLEGLLRIIYKEPEIKKPKLGKKPNFTAARIEEDDTKKLKNPTSLFSPNPNKGLFEIAKIINLPGNAKLLGPKFYFVENEYSIEIRNISGFTSIETEINIIFPLYLIQELSEELIKEFPKYDSDGENCIIRYSLPNRLYFENSFITDKFFIRVSGKNFNRAINSFIQIEIFSDLGHTTKDLPLKDSFIVSNEHGENKFLSDSIFI